MQAVIFVTYRKRWGDPIELINLNWVHRINLTGIHDIEKHGITYTRLHPKFTTPEKRKKKKKKAENQNHIGLCVVPLKQERNDSLVA